MDFPSKLLENAVNEVAQLPGIGKRTALRLVLHLLRQPLEQTSALTTSLDLLRTEIKYCKSCHAISDLTLCEICDNASRDHSIICVVEDVRDVIALENTQLYKGIYHVLNGAISFSKGITINDLNIEALIEKAKADEIDEIIKNKPKDLPM
mgnify:CR=1 FL=1